MRTFRSVTLVALTATTLVAGTPHAATTAVAQVEGRGWLSTFTCSFCLGMALSSLITGTEEILVLFVAEHPETLGVCYASCLAAVKR